MLRGGTLSACAMAGTAVFRIVVSSDSMKNPTATSHGTSRLAVSLKGFSLLGAGKRPIHDELSFGDQPAQMGLVVKAFGVNLVNILRSRGPCREPAGA